MSTAFSAVDMTRTRISSLGIVPFTRVEVPGYEIVPSYSYPTMEEITAAVGELENHVPVSELRQRLLRVTHRAGAELRDFCARAQAIGATHIQVG